MALPEKPFSRKEQYLAKIAGEDVEIPEEPFSREEMYLEAIAEGGGGGGTSNFNDLENRPQLNGTAMTGNTNITNFTGTDGVNAGAQGLVPAPAATDTDKFLKADGTWGTAGGGGPTVVQTTGTSTTDVMSQDATTKMVFADPNSKQQIQIGSNANGATNRSVAVGYWATTHGAGNHVCIGSSATTNGYMNVCIGYDTRGNNTNGCVCLGAQSGGGNVLTENGIVTVNSFNSNTGFRNTFTRVIRGVHDGIDTTDAATVNQLSQLVTAINSALGTSIMLASDGSITNANNNQNPGSNEEPNPDEPNPDDPSAPDDPSDPSDPSAPDEPAPDEPGPE